MADEKRDDREKMREELFGADSEGEEEDVPEQQLGEEEEDVNIYDAPEQGAELAEQVDGQEVSEEGQEGQQDEQAEAAEPGQDEEGGEYYDGQEGYPEDEAVEDDDEIARMMKGRGRKKAHEKSFEQMTQEVEAFLASMDYASEQDQESNKIGEPATAKLKMLPELQAKVAERRIHEVLINAGILGCLKGWIEPMQGGHLPNSKVRSVVLQALLQLMVDVTQPNVKDRLKGSQVGRAVLFLSRLPEETAANRRMAKQLVEAWSRPIFEQYSEGRMEHLRAQDERTQLTAARQQRKRKQREQTEADATAEAEGAARRKLKPGEPGFRWHAAVPQPARLDYIEQPESKALSSSQQASGGKSGKPDRLGRKLKILNRKVQNGAGRAAKISLEGRGMMI